MKKLLTIVLALLMIFSSSALTACGTGSENNYNSTKTQLYVGLFKAGLGREWLDRAKIDFEEKYKDVSFEEGKQGVEVVIDYKVAEFKVGTFQSNVPSLVNSIYFLDQSDYAGYSSLGILKNVNNYLNKDVYDDNGDLIDITFNAENSALSFGEGGTTSMMDIMNEEYVYSMKHIDGNYYAAPYRNIVTGVIYDADYFNSAKLYFFKDENPETGEKFGATQADIDRGSNEDGSLEIGYGPDGVKGTTDDGMPETWNDFMTLIDNMGSTYPFVWSGAENYQKMYMYMDIWANYEGYDNFKLNYSFEGEHSELGEIKPSNAIEKLTQQEGRKAAIKALYDIASNSSYVYSNWKSTDEFESQKRFVKSKKESKRIAMLVDGGYWEVNMIGEFNSMAQSNPQDGFGKRDFRLLPIPNFVGVDGIKDQTVTNAPEVLYCAGPGIVCLPSNYRNKNAVQDSLAELFLYFTHSREQMIKFTGATGGCVKPYDFKVTEADHKYLTKYGINIFNYIADGAKMISDTPTTTVVKQNNTVLFSETEGYYKFHIVSGGVHYTDPISYCIGAGASKTVDQVYTEVVNNIKSKCIIQGI